MTTGTLETETRLLELEGQNCLKKITNILIEKGITEECYATKSRVKSQDNILEKQNRKQKDKPDYKIRDITDIIGVRFVTLFQCDMHIVYEKILKFLCDSSNRVLNKEPEEIIIYTGDKLPGTLNQRIIETTESYFPHFKILSQSSNEKYSSIHMVCRCQNKLTSKITNQDYSLPVEIQIRTVFEDAWGEIDHKFKYSKTRGINANIDPHTKSLIKAFKSITDSCMDFAECIKEISEKKPIIPTTTNDAISVVSDETILKRFADCGIENDLIEDYKKARLLRENATSLKEKYRTEEANNTYHTALESFEKIIEKILIGKDKEVTEEYTLLYYYCKMNIALCYFLTDNMDEINTAIQIYEELEIKYPNYPLLKMRLGQAYGRINDNTKALEQVQNAQTLCIQFQKEISEDHYPDELPKVDLEHMQYSIPRLIGFYNWTKSQDTSITEEEKKNFLSKAYCETYKCLQFADCSQRKVATYNNLLYYTMLCNQEKVSGVNCSEQEIKEQIAAINEILSTQENEITPPYLLDTLFKAYIFVKNRSSAKEVATKLQQVCLLSNISKNNVYPFFRFAQDATQYLEKNIKPLL